MSVLVNFGLRIPAWFNIYGRTPEAREDATGLEAARRYVHGLIDAEVERGISPDRILLGGFSMVGHCHD